MYDFGHLVYDPKPRMKVDYYDNPSYNGEWQTWQKPAGAKFIYFSCVGGGGSGGCSSNTTAASNNGGGGGGGGSVICNVLMPAMLVPDTLYISVGRGGVRPVTSGGIGITGSGTYIAIDPTYNNFYNALAYAGGGQGGGAGGNTFAGGSGAGTFTAATSNTESTYGLSSRGLFNADSSLVNGNGPSGAVGGLSAAGATVSPAATAFIPLTGGAGGGGSGNNTAAAFAGGSITYSVGVSLVVNAGEHFSNNIGGLAGQSGKDGWVVTFPNQNIYYIGGSGGGGGNSSVSAGNGGNGARGCGGGGAGGTYGLNTLATPGNGGDGFAYITTFL